MGAHSLYIKDPSGVLTPEMAAAVTREVKEAFPELPLVIHTHYQTGFGYMTYMEAVKAGANGVECSLGFPDGAGQPYGLTMLRLFEELGLETGDPSKAAMSALSELCKEMRPLYPQANIARTPDISVESSGIAGGQRSILDKELRDLNQSHLIPLIDVEVARVRAEGGKVCQVTPVADTYAREAMRRLRGGDPGRDFVPGFTGILCGEGGLVKEPVDPRSQSRALLERTQSLAGGMVLDGSITGKAAVVVSSPDSKFLTGLVERMGTLARPTVIQHRIVEVSARIEQLEYITTKEDLLQSLDRKFTRYAKENPGASSNDHIRENPAASSLDTRTKINHLRVELGSLTEGLAAATPMADPSATGVQGEGNGGEEYSVDQKPLPILDQSEYQALLPPPSPPLTPRPTAYR